VVGNRCSVFGERCCLIVMDNDAGRQPEILWRTFHEQKRSWRSCLRRVKVLLITGTWYTTWYMAHGTWHKELRLRRNVLPFQLLLITGWHSYKPECKDLNRYVCVRVLEGESEGCVRYSHRQKALDVTVYHYVCKYSSLNHACNFLALKIVIFLVYIWLGLRIIYTW